MKKFTTPETIRTELNRLGDKAHGMKVFICNHKYIETEAIISMSVSCYGRKVWYFCHDKTDWEGFYIKDCFGKTGSDNFHDDDDEDSIKWFSYKLTNNPMKFTTTETIRAELNRLGDKAHGMKVFICNNEDVET